ncbi:MAG: 50S ribosomal protein L23 [Acidobacteria bacterium]|nr:MAG: 50S ribosomal protein L23 [Acidobacteriota bacterium]PIE89982.1 MAG: 50S ribosomal protein L23 [Acidobacteriota bacterium]
MNTRMNKILKAPLLTEKGMYVKEHDNVHIFEVDRAATKQEIRAAVEREFDVKVTDVKTVNVKGKTKRVGRHLGKKADFKKAYVTVAPGSGEIDYFEGT